MCPSNIIIKDSDYKRIMEELDYDKDSMKVDQQVLLSLMIEE